MGRPKALIEWRGQSFLRRVIGLAEASSCAPIIAVEGAIALPACELGSASSLKYSDWSRGQLSSLETCIAAFFDPREETARASNLYDHDQPANKTLGSALVTGVMVLAIDRPRIQPATCQALAAAHRREHRAIWQPAIGARRGHPILYPWQLFAELLALPSAEGPRDWLRSPEIDIQRRSLQVQDTAIFENFDRPADLRSL